MSENIVKVSGCGAPSEPEQIRSNAAIITVQRENESIREQIKTIGQASPFNISVKSTACLALFVAFISLLLAFYALAKAEFLLDIFSILQ